MEIDLRNTWCIANVPNHDKLRLLGYDPKPVGSHRCGDYYYMLNSYEIYDSDIFNRDFKQVELNEDNEFVYVEEKEDIIDESSSNIIEKELNEDNIFTKYGFEKPAFECEIWKVETSVSFEFIHGLVLNDYAHPMGNLQYHKWNKLTGKVIIGCSLKNLVQLKKPWYETCKFPCVIMADYCMPVVVKHYDDGYVYDFRDNKYCVKSWRLLRNTEIEGLKQ